MADDFAEVIAAAINDLDARIIRLERAAGLEHTCHCGRPIYINHDIEPDFTRGLCRDCDLVRCDAYPGECGR